MENGKSMKKGYRIIRAKRIGMIVGTIAIGLMLSFYILYSSVYDVGIRYADDMKQAVESGRREYNYSLEQYKVYNNGNIEVTYNLAGYGAYLLGGKANIKMMDELVTSVGASCAVNIFKGNVQDGKINGKLYADPRNYEVKLSDDELYTLFTEGYVQGSDKEYTSAPLDDGYFFVGWRSGDIINYESVLNAFVSEVDEYLFRVNTETGLIEDSSNADFIDAECSEIISMDELRKISPLMCVNVKLNTGKSAKIIRDEEENGQILFAYHLMSDIILEQVQGIASSLILSWLFLIFILIYVLRFIRKQREQKLTEYVRLLGKRYVDSRLIAHVVGIIMLAIILILASVLYVKTLVNYSSQNINAMKNLNEVENINNLYKENYAIIDEDFLDMHENLISFVSEYYNKYPDKLSEKELIDLRDRMPYVYRITFYDKDGTVACDSGVKFEEYEGASVAGYSLSKDENEPEYIGWDLLEGKIAKASYSSETSGTYYILGLRQDKQGIVRIEVDGTPVETFSEYASLKRIMENANFGLSDRGYIDKNRQDKVYWYASGASTYEEKNNTLSGDVLVNGYSGITRVDGRKCYVNTSNEEGNEYIYLSSRYAYDLSGFTDLGIIISVVVAFMLQLLCIVIISTRKFDTPPEKMRVLYNGVVKETLDDQMMDERFRRLAMYMLISTCIMVVVMFGLDTLYGQTSLLSYLFGNDTWSKGLNLFSITMILLLVSGSVVGGVILQMLVVFFTKNMGPRGVTIGRMISSIIKFIILIVVIITIIIDLGANPSTLIAGAGVAGVLISFCAQQTVNDFMSGFFIVFEGLFNIGDWITVNDFRGEVMEIGIRTTKIANGDNVQIINNSELKQITLMAPNGKGAICTVAIAYKEDIDRVMALIRDNTERYSKEIPELQEGPYVDGVTDLGDSGVTLYIWSPAEQSKVKALERDLRRVTKELFDENNIEIPFNQVTIHTEAEVERSHSKK